MNCLVAYRLLHLANGKEPSAKEIQALLTVAGGSPNMQQIEELLKKVEGHTPEELIQKGMSKVAVSSAPAAAAPAEKTEAAPQEESEKEESSDMDLFG